MGPLVAAVGWMFLGAIYASLGYALLLMSKKHNASLLNVFSIVIGGAGGVAIALALSFLVWHGRELTGSEPPIVLALMVGSALAGSAIGLKVAAKYAEKEK